MCVCVCECVCVCMRKLIELSLNVSFLMVQNVILPKQVNLSVNCFSVVM